MWSVAIPAAVAADGAIETITLVQTGPGDPVAIDGIGVPPERAMFVGDSVNQM